MSNDLQCRLLEAVHGAEGLQLVEDGTSDRRGVVLHLPLNPGAVQDLAGRGPRLGVPGAHREEELLGLVRDPGKLIQVKRDASPLDRIHDILVALPTERGRTGQENVQDDPDAPDVALLAVLAAQHLGRHVVRGADHRRHVGCVRPLVLDLVVEALRYAKVNDLQRVLAYRHALALKQEVLRLQIPVSDVLGVHVVHGADNLLDDMSSIPLTEEALVNDGVKQLTPVAHLHDKVDLVLVLEGLVKSHNVWMIHDCIDLNFVEEGIHVRNRCLLDCLDCTDRARLLVLAGPDSPESTRADGLLAHLVLVLRLLPGVVRQDASFALGLPFAEHLATVEPLPSSWVCWLRAARQHLPRTLGAADTAHGWPRPAQATGGREPRGCRSYLPVLWTGPDGGRGAGGR
mmetsp:Transcript_28589/g.77464  ORF Transcript_28589/g.77464 Transcript_28589/m.77464 type:complete len:401 (-) Transcript_28589:29-1231(-)